MRAASPSLLSWAHYIVGETVADIDVERALAAYATAIRYADEADCRLFAMLARGSSVALAARSGAPAAALDQFDRLFDQQERVGNELVELWELRFLVVLLARIEAFHDAAVLAGALLAVQDRYPVFGPYASPSRRRWSACGTGWVRPRPTTRSIAVPASPIPTPSPTPGARSAWRSSSWPTAARRRHPSDGGAHLATTRRSAPLGRRSPDSRRDYICAFPALVPACSRSGADPPARLRRSIRRRIIGVKISCIARSIFPPGQTMVFGRDMNESCSIDSR